MKRFFLWLMILCLPVYAAAEGFSVVEEETPMDRIRASALYLMSRMTLEEKAAQLFIVAPEDLAGTDHVTGVTDALREGAERYRVGGVVLFGRNMADQRDLMDMTACLKDTGERAAPFIGLYEAEMTGSVIETKFGADGLERLERLKMYGCDLVFAPSLDIVGPDTVREIRQVSYGSTAEEVLRGAIPFARRLRGAGIVPVFSHFPGIGGAENVNTLRGRGRIVTSLDDPDETSMIPFAQGAAFGGGIILVTALPYREVDKDLPSCLSPDMVTGRLRGVLGYKGVIMTDSLRQPLVTGAVKNSQAGVMALEAGCDMILLPANFRSALKGVTDAVAEGRLTEKRLEESVLRILELKCAYLQGLDFESVPFEP